MAAPAFPPFFLPSEMFQVWEGSWSNHQETSLLGSGPALEKKAQNSKIFCKVCSIPGHLMCPLPIQAEFK